MSPLVPLLSTALAFVILVLLCLPLARPADGRWLAAGAAYLLADVAATIFPPHIPGLYGNWSGKLASLALAIGVAVSLRMSRAELPLGPPVGRAAWGWAAFAAVLGAAASTALNLAFGQHGPVRVDKLVYQATIPGVAEELAYRGVAFALLVRAYGGAARPRAALAAAACLTGLFAIGHGVGFSHGRLSVQWISFAYAGAFGALLFLVRLRSRSLPALAAIHNFANAAATLSAG